MHSLVPKLVCSCCVRGMCVVTPASAILENLPISAPRVFCAETCSALLCPCLLSRAAAVPRGFVPPRPQQIFLFSLPCLRHSFPCRFPYSIPLPTALSPAIHRCQPSGFPGCPGHLPAQDPGKQREPHVNPSHAQATSTLAQRRECECTL